MYIYNSNLTTVLRQCYADDVRLFNKAKNLPSVSVTGLLFNRKEFFLFIFHDKPMLKHVIFDFHRLKKIESPHCFITC